jgi:hypothetical protein
MYAGSTQSDVKQPKIAVLLILVLLGYASVFADVTYWLHSSVPSDIAASVQEAVGLYNKHGSFNKNLVVYYDPGVPTANGNYNGTINFGGSRNTRVALHEMGHTVGMGTYWRYGELIAGGVWGGFYGRKLAIEMGGYADGIHGDGHAIWPWGLNYDNEDNFMDRIKHVRIMAAIRCDMGIASFAQEPISQTVGLGDIAVFSVASPTADSYQWYKNGAALSNGGDISGATRNTLQIANTDLTDEGNYYCVVVGAGETLGSRTRRLMIERQVSQWNFDGNANDSVGSNHGTAWGSPVYTTGKIGQAIDLDGIDDAVTLPAGVADGKDITIAAWVNWDGGGNWQRVFDFGTGTSQYLFLTPSTGSVMRFAIKNGGGEQVVSTAVLPTGQGVHVAVVLRNNAATIYVNGQAAASNGAVTIDPVDFMPTNNYIGDSQFSADPLFNGRIDDFRIYNYALAGSDIWDLWGQSANHAPLFNADPIALPAGNVNAAYTGQTLANDASDLDSNPLTFSKVSGPAWLSVAANGTLSGTPGAADGGENTFVVRVTDSLGASDDVALNIIVHGLPDAHYLFEGTVNNSAGSNHGTATGSPAYTAGILGQAIDLDGTDDYVTLPAGIANKDDITIAAWVNWDGGGAWQRIFDFGNNTTQYMFLTPRSGSDTLSFVITATGNGSREQKLETSQLAVGQWAHVAVTLSGNTGRLYVNGQLKDIDTAMTIDPLDFNPTINYIGKSQWPDALFNGRIDDFRIYDYALSAAEIAMLSLPPSFTSDPIGNLGGIELEPYTGQSLATYVSGTGVLTFSKVSGPGWLNVSSSGELSGIPADADVGANTFTVRVTDNGGLSDTAQMNIQIANIYSGVRGTEDLLGLAAQWLRLNCADSPACGGADLDGDQDVDLADFSMLANYWMIDETLQLHLKLDETSGTAAGDGSVYARPGTLTNGPVWSTGRTGGALTFDGANDYVEISGYKGVAGTTSRTCSAWIKTSGSTSNMVIMDWGTAVSGQKWLFGIFTTGQLALYTWTPYIQTNISITDNQWHHVAAVLTNDGTPDVNEIKLYVDGLLQATTVSSAQAINTIWAANVLLGACDNAGAKGFYFNGLMDEVRIYNRALNEQEIASIAQ